MDAPRDGITITGGQLLTNASTIQLLQTMLKQQKTMITTSHLSQGEPPLEKHLPNVHLAARPATIFHPDAPPHYIRPTRSHSRSHATNTSRRSASVQSHRSTTLSSMQPSMRESRRMRRPSIHEQQLASIGRAMAKVSLTPAAHMLPNIPARSHAKSRCRVHALDEPLSDATCEASVEMHAATDDDNTTPIYTGLFNAGTFSTRTSIVVGDPAELLFKEHEQREKMFGRDMSEFRTKTESSNDAAHHLTPFLSVDKLTTIGMDAKMAPGTYDVKTRYKRVGNTQVVHQIILTKIDF